MSRGRVAQGCAWPRLALLIAAVLLVGGCGARTDNGAPLARKRLWELFFNRGDAAAVAALYARHAELVMSGTPPVHGRGAIGAAIAAMVHSGVKVSIGTDRIAAAGDLAYFFGPYRVLRQQKLVERGTYLEIWRRYGRRWLIELDVNAVGAPVPQGPQH